MTSADQFDRIRMARTQLLDRGVVADELLPEAIGRSWMRCANSGLSLELRPEVAPLTQQALNEIREKNSRLLSLARPEMENLHSQTIGTPSMVILTDAHGTILHALGEDDFVNKAQRVALQPGVSWREENTGTNAIGTALVEKAPVYVMGAEHYFSQNAFLNCSAAPILDPHGHTIGVLDVSGDYRQPLAHTMALVRMSAQLIENRLFSVEFPREITLHFHARPEFVGTLWEGIAVFSPDGRLRAINRSGASQLGLAQIKLGDLSFPDLFETPLASLLGSAKRHPAQVMMLKTQQGQQLHTRVDTGIQLQSARASQGNARATPPEPKGDHALLRRLDSGDAQMRTVVERISKVLQRDLPILIEGETGTGKELLAKAVHQASGRKGPFVAINCASIPEGLIEAELFGYEEGAFTGARRSGMPGKILQANGGTLFLDEIGEMPLHLQARLLRVLQEREITQLGGAKSVAIDIALISATNRKLREGVEAGDFREDLYYRLNGLRVSLPPLRQRSDLDHLIDHILQEESPQPVMLHRETAALFRRHPWRGNVRQLRNVLRAALAFMDDDHVLRPQHLPDDFVEEAFRAPQPNARAKPEGKPRIADAENDLILQTLTTHAGNVTLAARQLGISRATLYRKLKKLGPGAHAV